MDDMAEWYWQIAYKMKSEKLDIDRYLLSIYWRL